MSRSFPLSVLFILAASSGAQAAVVSAVNQAPGRTSLAPVTALGGLAIRGSLGSSPIPGQTLNLSASLSPSLKVPTLSAPAVSVLSPVAPQAAPTAAVKVGMLAEAAAPHIAAAMDAKTGAEASQNEAAALLEPLKPAPAASEPAPEAQPLVRDVSFDDGLPAEGGTTKHMRQLLLDSLSQDPAAWKREFSRLGIDLSRGEPRFRVLRTDMHLQGRHGKGRDFFVDLAYNIQVLSGSSRSRVRLILNPASGEIRAFQGGTQRSEPVLARLSFARGVSLEERSLLYESLRRRKTAWNRELAAARFSLLGRSPAIKVLSVSTQGKAGSEEGPVRTYLVRWQRGNRTPRLMVVSIRPDGLTPRISPAPPKR